ncbi:hypothetical protein C2845_PM15G04030 [Panicum miliaceum]|uniref:Uncharacterized protein n=1 Tax=Panicum miliaceum TaxID=4540 RepID=A0A3L6Q829_PANMI|nr:hypothetical protein C2845_PM15G04030 [Panicum miliaceum]
MWPNEVVKVEVINGDGFLTNDNGLKRWRLICGLITRQRVGINVKIEDVDQPTRKGLFEIMKKYLEFPEGTFEAQMNRVRGAALKSIAKLHRHFKSNLTSDGSKRLADRVIELKDQEIGVREHDILSTAIDMPEHRGRVRGVSSLKGWKEGYDKDNEGLWKKKKRTSMDPNRLKKEIMDEIFGKLRAAGIDVDAALGAPLARAVAPLRRWNNH